MFEHTIREATAFGYTSTLPVAARADALGFHKGSIIAGLREFLLEVLPGTITFRFDCWIESKTGGIECAGLLTSDVTLEFRC